MTPSVTQEKPEMSSFLSGTFHHVDVDRIEKELVELWQEAGKGTGGGEPSVTRACSITFILFSRNPSCEVEAGHLLDEITLKHPCRAILALAVPAEEEHLEAWVTARCRMIPGQKDKQICCEQITVRWQGRGTRNLASVVSPLQLVDLPTWLWWQEERPTKEMLGPFFPFVERLLVDTALMDGKPSQMFDLKDVFNRLKDGGLLFDLNWRRLLPWRQAIARSFSDSSGILGLEDLDLISSVTIGVAESESKSEEKPYSAQALLLIGWLASRLSWSFVSLKKNGDDSVNISFKWSRKKIDVCLKSMPLENVTPGTVCYFDCDFVGKNDESLVVMQKAGLPGLEATLSQRGEKRDNLTVSERPVGKLLVDVLDNPSAAELYRELIEITCELCGALK
ncbi:MAG: glucose-6-phosphate dehydrogenase assembly protein OpcA [Candidatus Obscuribacterales bacterium]|nr:glucose-6-phosphate dehydrogenase assembly protein OpcA [Candidatus Obscuribacterales bacterium]